MAAAEVNWGRWIVRCPRCPSALAVYGEPRYRCDDCGHEDLILWPAADTMHGIARLLGMRPDPSTRNWQPHETLDDLLAENGLRGVLPDLGLPPGTPLLTVVDGARIGIDRLPLPPAPQREALV